MISRGPADMNHKKRFGHDDCRGPADSGIPQHLAFSPQGYVAPGMSHLHACTSDIRQSERKSFENAASRRSVFLLDGVDRTALGGDGMPNLRCGLRSPNYI